MAKWDRKPLQRTRIADHPSRPRLPDTPGTTEPSGEQNERVGGTFRLTQLMTGHDSFSRFFGRICRPPSAGRSHCGPPDGHANEGYVGNQSLRPGWFGPRNAGQPGILERGVSLLDRLDVLQRGIWT